MHKNILVWTLFLLCMETNRSVFAACEDQREYLCCDQTPEIENCKPLVENSKKIQCLFQDSHRGIIIAADLTHPHQ